MSQEVLRQAQLKYHAAPRASKLAGLSNTYGSPATETIYGQI